MPCWDYKLQPIFVNNLNVKPRVFHGQRDNSELHFAIKDQFQGFGAFGTNDVESNTRVLLLEFAD